MNAVPARRKSRRQAAERTAQELVAMPPKQQIIEAHLRERIDPARHQAMVAEAAYFYAEHRGFEPGHELDDWLAAEDQICATLSLADLQAQALIAKQGL
jgi:hypothetical protein